MWNSNMMMVFHWIYQFACHALHAALTIGQSILFSLWPLYFHHRCAILVEAKYNCDFNHEKRVKISRLLKIHDLRNLTEFKCNIQRYNLRNGYVKINDRRVQMVMHCKHDAWSIYLNTFFSLEKPIFHS